MVPLDSHVLAAHLQLYSGSLVWVFIFRERPRPTTTTSTVERWERRAVDTIERQVSTTATTIPPRVARLTGGRGDYLFVESAVMVLRYYHLLLTVRREVRGLGEHHLRTMSCSMTRLGVEDQNLL